MHTTLSYDNSTLDTLIDRVSGLLSGRLSDSFIPDLIIDIFRYQFDHVPVYRKFCLNRGVNPDEVPSWKAIPALPVTAFKDHDITSLTNDQISTTFFSSGTTSDCRSRHYHSVSSLKLYEQSLLTHFKSAAVFENTPLSAVSFTPPPALCPNSSLVHMLESLNTHVFGGEMSFLGKLDSNESWQLESHKVLNLLQHHVDQKRPLYLFTTAFGLVDILDELTTRNERIVLPSNCVLFETGGYKGRTRSVSRADLYQWAMDRLSLKPNRIVSEYGMCETGSQAYDTSAKYSESGGIELKQRLFRFPSWVLWDVISPETGRPVGCGERGWLKILDPVNVASIMALQTEDQVIKWTEGFEFVGRSLVSDPRGCSLMQSSNSN